LVRIDPRYFRPAEVDLLIGDATKAKEKLGWTATTTLEELCREMVLSDLELFGRDAYLRAGGHAVTTPQDS
jgi:GDPmannose 4,6-dehydratase